MTAALVTLVLAVSGQAAYAQSSTTPAAPAASAPQAAPPAPVPAPAAAAPPASPAPGSATPAAPQPAPAPSTTAAATTTLQADCPGCDAAAEAYWQTFRVVTVFLVVAALGVLISLNRDPEWTLGKALSEEGRIMLPAVDVNSDQQPIAPSGANVAKLGGQMMIVDAKGQPAEGTQLMPSTSRLIAVFGLAILAAVMLGVGYGIIWSLFVRNQLPNLDGIGTYLMGGAALFAPYAFNQLKDAFKPAGK